MEDRFTQAQRAIAQERAALEVDRFAARRLVTRADTAASAYIRPGSRYVFRGLAAAYLACLAAGIVLLVSGRFMYAALAFLSGLVLQQVWGGLAVELFRLIASRDRAFFGLALREGWITLIEPPVGPGRRTRPIEFDTDTASEPYAAEINAARTALAERPDDAQARFNLGVTYVLAGDFAQALEEARILSMLDARLATKLQQLARLLSS